MEPPADLVAAMQARGKWTNRHAARKLTAASIRAYGESRTRGVVALFDQADPPPHSPPAWLTTALREGWRPGCKPKPDTPAAPVAAAPAPEQRACEACGSVYRPAPDQDDVYCSGTCERAATPPVTRRRQGGASGRGGAGE